MGLVTGQTGLRPDGSPTEATRSSFRVDIQALRMVAVTAVVIYHLWPERLPGGYVGVDVFFVISGLLITQHLLQEVKRTGTLRLGQFWARRIRRLLPAAFIVLVATLVLLAFTMPPLTWQNNLDAIRASALYVVNWLLGFQAVDYLAAENNHVLVTHYWSLAVEEQFYLVWPLLIVAAVVVGRNSDYEARRRRVIWALTGLFVLSFAGSILFTPRMPELAFYATPVRAWEFAIGGLLAIFTPYLAERLSRVVRVLLSWTGLTIVVVASIVLQGKLVSFPGWIAIVPVGGAVLFLAACDPHGPFSLHRLAGSRAVQWIGDNSYSIYLWHWPPIVAAPWILGGDLEWGAKLVILVATLVLAALTKRFVEDPVRRGRWWRASPRRPYIFAVVGSIVIAGACTLWMSVLQAQWDERRADAVQAIQEEQPCFGAAAMVGSCDGGHARPLPMDVAFAAVDIDDALSDCQQGLSGDEVVFCEFGETRDPERTVVVIGNSHALRLVPALTTYGSERGWRILLAAKTSCLGPMTPHIADRFDDCQAWSENVYEQLTERDDIDAVIFGSHVGAQDYLAGADATEDQLALARDGIADTFAGYRSHGIPVMVVGDVPGTRPRDAPSCVAADPNAADPCSRPRDEAVLSNLLVDVARSHPELVSTFDLDDFLCGPEVCHAVVGGMVAYSDSHHITDTFAATLGQFLGPAVNGLFDAHAEQAPRAP